VVMYHYVRDTERTAFPRIRALSLADFERQLDWLEQHYRIVPYKEFANALHGSPPTEPTALLTFDDGLMDHYETVLPILKARDITGVFFLCTATLETPPQLLPVHAIHFLLARLGAADFAATVERALARAGWTAAPAVAGSSGGLYRYDAGKDAAIKRLLNYEVPYDLSDAVLSALFREHVGSPEVFAASLYLRPEVLRDMVAAGMTFGGHTHHHRVLARLTLDEQRSEVAEGVSRIRALTGQTSVPFSLPYGQPRTYTADTLRILRAAGYDSAFSTVRGTVDFATVDAYQLPRLDTKDLPPFVPVSSA